MQILDSRQRIAHLKKKLKEMAFVRGGQHVDYAPMLSQVRLREFKSQLYHLQAV